MLAETVCTITQALQRAGGSNWIHCGDSCRPSLFALADAGANVLLLRYEGDPVPLPEVKLLHVHWPLMPGTLRLQLPSMYLHDDRRMYTVTQRIWPANEHVRSSECLDRIGQLFRLVRTLSLSIGNARGPDAWYLVPVNGGCDIALQAGLKAFQRDWEELKAGLTADLRQLCDAGVKCSNESPLRHLDRWLKHYFAWEMTNLTADKLHSVSCPTQQVDMSPQDTERNTT